MVSSESFIFTWRTADGLTAETTANTLAFLMAYLALYPEEQVKLYERMFLLVQGKAQS